MGGEGFDVFQMATDPSVGGTWSFSGDATGNVVVTGGNDTTLTLSEIEEVDITLGSADDTVIIGDVSNTDLVKIGMDAGTGTDTLVINLTASDQNGRASWRERVCQYV